MGVIAICVFKQGVPFDHFLFLRTTLAAKEDVPKEATETVLILNLLNRFWSCYLHTAGGRGWWEGKLAHGYGKQLYGKVKRCSHLVTHKSVPQSRSWKISWPLSPPEVIYAEGDLLFCSCVEEIFFFF